MFFPKPHKALSHRHVIHALYFVDSDLCSFACFHFFSPSRAEIFNEENHLISTGHKREHKAHFCDFEEKAETGAIGRALAHCGYGTQFAPDLDEGERIVDAPQAKDDPAKNYFEPLPGLLREKPVNLQDEVMTISKQHAGKKFSEMVEHHMDFIKYMRERTPTPTGQLKKLFEYADAKAGV